MRRSAGRRSGAYTQTERVLELMTILRARRTAVRLDALAERVGVSEKQLRRDLAMLSAAGLDPKLVRIDGRSAVVLARSSQETIALSLRERLTLLAMRDAFESLHGTPFAEDAKRISEKLVATLPDALRLEFEALGPRFQYVPDGGIKHYGDHADVVDELFTGALRRQKVDATYVSARGTERVEAFEPWGLALYRNGLYVVGRWERDAAPRVLAIERFRAAERRRRSHFEVPADFSIASFFHGAFGMFPGAPRRVVLDFDASVQGLVEARRFHTTQETVRRSDGGVRMTLHVPTSPDVVAWLVGWGPRVVVVEPEDLADAVREEHRCALERGMPNSGTIHAT
ncbi:MAG: WYL domain-containing protein [Myxococcales bacterium]|nr:WYL domain-containing protein [Myxococcales bacterium]